MYTPDIFDIQRFIVLRIRELSKQLDSNILGERLPSLIRNLTLDAILKIDEEKACCTRLK